MLSGDDRALTAARGIADYLVLRSTNTRKGNPRQWGWPQIALVAVYEATNDKRYVEAARAFARGGMAAHPPALGKDWKIGILAEALAYTHSVTHDPAISDWLTRYAAAVAEYGAPRDARLLPALAYVGRVSHRPQYSKLAQQTIGTLKLGTWGKPLTIAGRIGFSILGN